MRLLELEQFSVTAFIFDAQRTLKAKQTAPGRRSLEARSTKYSAMVLDGSPVAPMDVVLGVNQAQRVSSDNGWRTDLQSAAEEGAKP